MDNKIVVQMHNGVLFSYENKWSCNKNKLMKLEKLFWRYRGLERYML